MNEMAAIELGGDPDGQRELAHRLIGALGIGDRADEIAAHADEHLGGAVVHRLDRFDRMMSVLTRRIEAEYIANAVEIFLARLFVDPDGAIALDVGMAADRRDTRAGLAEISLEQEEVGDLLEEL